MVPGVFQADREGVGDAQDAQSKTGEQPKFGAQVAFARVATGLAWTGLGALAVGVSAAGAVAIGALAIRALAVKRGRIQRLDIEELEVGRLHVRELVVEREQKPVVEQEQTLPPQARIAFSSLRRIPDDGPTPECVKRNFANFAFWSFSEVGEESCNKYYN